MINTFRLQCPDYRGKDVCLEADRPSRDRGQYTSSPLSLPFARVLSLLYHQLYDQQNPLTPVAWYRTAYRHIVDGAEVVRMPTLSLQPEVESIAHLVLASLIVVEQKYRMKSQQAIVRPAGAATGALTLR